MSHTDRGCGNGIAAASAARRLGCEKTTVSTDERCASWAAKSVWWHPAYRTASGHG